MNLFELNEKYRELEQRDDLDETTLKDTLDSINDSRETKLDNIATWIENNEWNIDKLNKKIKDFQSDVKHLKNTNERLKKYLSDVLEDMGVRKFYTSRNIIKQGRKSVQTHIVDETKIPKEFFNKKVSTSINKTLIKETIQNGKPVPGAELQTNRKAVIK